MPLAALIRPLASKPARLRKPMLYAVRKFHEKHHATSTSCGRSTCPWVWPRVCPVRVGPGCALVRLQDSHAGMSLYMLPRAYMVHTHHLQPYGLLQPSLTFRACPRGQRPVPYCLAYCSPLPQRRQVAASTQVNLFSNVL